MRSRSTRLSATGNNQSNLDGLALDLAFAADKTLTARRGPTPTFSRASGAMQVGATGLIEWAPENLYARSQDFNDANWLKTNVTLSSGILDPLSGTSAFKLIETATTGTHVINSTVTPTTIPHTLSIFAKKGERNWIALRLGAVNTYFNLDTGTFTPSSNPAAITDVGNGWYRCSVTSSAGTQGSYRMSADGVTDSYTGDGTSGIFIFGAQLERHPSARAYIPTTTAAVFGPRFDHDPVTLASRGLLIEEQRTNVLQHSANFKNSTSSNYWENLSATTVTVDQIASPDGGVNADLLTTSTTSFDVFTRRNGVFVGSTQYSYSIFLKQGPSLHRYVGLYIGAGVNAARFPFFDFNNPTTVQIPSGTMVGTINSTRVDAYPNGWYRVSVTFTTAATPVNAFCGVYISNSSGDLLSSSVAGLNAYIWGIQLELGSFPTSYIPTTTTALTRSADVCSITTAGWSNAGNDTMVASYFLRQAVTGITILEGSPSVSWLSITSAGTGGVLNRNIYRHGGTDTRSDILSSTAYSLTNLNKVAITSGEQSCFNGSLNQQVQADPSQADISTSLSIGSRGNGASNFLNGHIASIQYFRKRLPNAKLQSLTA